MFIDGRIRRRLLDEGGDCSRNDVLIDGMRCLLMGGGVCQLEEVLVNSMRCFLNEWGAH